MQLGRGVRGMSLKRRAAALGLVLVLILSVWLLGTYASRMTDRRIDRSVGTHLAGLEARVRAVEALIGGGRQRAIESHALPDLDQIGTGQTSYGDLEPGGVPPPSVVGPQVTVKVGHIGTIQALVSATPWPTAQEGGDEIAEAQITLELTGTNSIPAATFAANHGYISLAIELHTADAFDIVAIIGSVHRVFIIDGLDPGDTTVTMKYLTNGPAVNVNNRHLLVAPF